MNILSLGFLIIGLCVIKSKANEVPVEIRGLVAGLREKCHRETGVDIEHVDRTVEGYFHPSEVLGCYFSCIFNSFDLLDHDGHIDFEKILPKIPESFKEHGAEMIEKCRHITGKNPCDSALNVVQCFQQTNPSDNVKLMCVMPKKKQLPFSWTFNDSTTSEAEKCRKM